MDTPRPHRYTITFEAEPDLANWTKPYSFAEYCDELSRHIQELNTVVGADTCFQTAQDDNKRLRVSTFWVEFPVSAPALPLTKEIDSRVQTLRMLHERIENTLLAIASSNSVAVSFSFPEQVKVACEQYLIYFVEFLRDLGVEATSDLRDEAGRVLFTVTPKDPLEALDNIRVALEIYLRLPASPISDGEAGLNDVSTQKLLANIHHLTGQLALARALLETKNATIQAQQVAISQNVVSATVVVDSIVEITPVPQKDDKEEFLGGTLAITKYQGKGFEINVPELIRMLKRRFGKSS